MRPGPDNVCREEWAARRPHPRLGRRHRSRRRPGPPVGVGPDGQGITPPPAARAARHLPPQNVRVGTRKKSTAMISRACVARNARHIGEGRGDVRCMYLATVSSATV